LLLLALLITFMPPLSADSSAGSYAEATVNWRSSCLDRFEALSISTVSGGKWLKSVSIDPLDDSKTVKLGLVADSGKSSWGDPVVFVVRCKQGKLDVYIDWNDYLGGVGDDTPKVTSRLGDSRATNSRWSYSTNYEGTFYAGSNVCNFILDLVQVDRFVAQITPYMGNPIIAVFDVSGLAFYLPELLGACQR